MRKWFIAFIIFVVSTSALSASVNHFRVGVLDARNNQGVYHVATAIWQRLTRQLNFDTTYKKFPNEKEAFQGLRDKKIDIVVGPVIAKPRTPGIIFLSSYITDQVGVFVPYQPLSFWERLLPLLRVFGSTAIIILVVLMIFVGIIVWLVERKHNPQFANRPLKGIGDGFWFAIVTMTTVGYGDKAPITVVGRVVTTIWLFLMLVLLSFVTAIITAELTSAKVSKLHAITMDDFKGQKVVLLKGDKKANYLVKHYRCRPIVANKISDAIQLLQHRKVAAGFLNRVNARYYIYHHPMVDVKTTDLVFENGRYAFAMRGDDKRISNLDEILLLFDDGGQLRAIEDKVLGLDHDVVKRKI